MQRLRDAITERRAAMFAKETLASYNAGDSLVN